MKRRFDLGKGLGEGVGNFVTHTIPGVIHRISEGVVWLGAGLLIFVVLLTVCDSFGRYFLNSPIVGSIEIVRLVMVGIVFSGMVYVAAREGNVKVNIIISRFPGPVQRILAFIMTFLGTVAFAAASWQLWLAAEKAVRINQYSPALHIPYAPFKFAAAIAAGLICLLLLISLPRTLSKRK